MSETNKEKQRAAESRCVICGSVKISLLEEVERSVLREIYSKAQKIGKFIADKKVQIKECDSSSSYM